MIYVNNIWIKIIRWYGVVAVAIVFASCSTKSSKDAQIAREDSLRAANEKVYQAQLARLQSLRETLTGPIAGGDITVIRGEKFKTNILDDSITVITGDFEKLNAKLERAQKDSTTAYGALLTRFRLLKTQHKYLTGTYTDEAHLLRFTTEVTFDDKHEEDRDFYFDNGTLVYFHERHTSAKEEQDLMFDDSYFLRNGAVVYAYRDEGTADEVRDRMNVMSLKRYLLKGDLTAHVAKEFDNFKTDYEILLNQPLEPLIYPGDGKQQ